MGFIATVLFIGLTIGSGYFYLKIIPGTDNVAWKVRCAVRGALTFLVIFFALNMLVDDHTPRWFYRFIMTFGDATGVCLVMMVSAALNALAARYLFSKTISESHRTG
ncbi:MAG: hypothetical protein ABIH39_05615 [Candidatus Margulisiibacteriota bacterium]